jgi:hypothetical protein
MLLEHERDALLNAEQTRVSAPPPMLLGVHDIGLEFASVLWSEVAAEMKTTSFLRRIVRGLSVGAALGEELQSC